jgi:hypothetical protein
MERTTGGYAMRIRTIGILATGAMAVAACGSAGSQSPSRPRAPTPVNLTVYVNDSRVLVSPSSLGAGPVLFIVTNQASASESLAISASGSSTPLASTAKVSV